MKIAKSIYLIILFCIITLASCIKADYNDDFTKAPPPPIGGYIASSEIASANLLAFWNFEGNNNETKSGTAPGVVTNASFTTGIKGQALRLTAGYLLYPTIAALSSKDALASCSVSLWIKVTNNGSTFSEFFTLARDTTKENDWLTILNVGAETGQSVANTYIDLHSWIGTYPAGTRKGGDNINDYGNAGVDYQVVPNNGSNWIHYVMRYDATAENIDLFANGVRVSNNNFRNRKGLGPIVMPTPTQVVIGAFSNTSTKFSKSNTLGFHGLLNGSIDELRVYNKALNDLEISALYQLEKLGR